MNKTILFIATGVLIMIGIWWFVSRDSSLEMGMMDMMPGMNMQSKGGLTTLTDENVPEVQPTQVVELADGDTFNLVASIRPCASNTDSIAPFVFDSRATFGGVTLGKNAHSFASPVPVSSGAPVRVPVKAIR